MHGYHQPLIIGGGLVEADGQFVVGRVERDVHVRGRVDRAPERSAESDLPGELLGGA